MGLIKHLLKNNPLTRHLREEDQEILINAIKPVNIKKGETIIKQGEDGDFW